MIFDQTKSIVQSDPAAPAREAEADQLFYLRDELNQEVMRLPAKERRRRWNEYLFRLDDLMKKSLSCEVPVSALEMPYMDNRSEVSPARRSAEICTGRLMRTPASCSKGAGEVLPMFEVANVFVCSECVMLFAEKLAEGGDGALADPMLRTPLKKQDPQ